MAEKVRDDWGDCWDLHPAPQVHNLLCYCYTTATTLQAGIAPAVGMKPTSAPQQTHFGKQGLMPL